MKFSTNFQTSHLFGIIRFYSKYIQVLKFYIITISNLKIIIIDNFKFIEKL